MRTTLAISFVALLAFAGGCNQHKDTARVESGTTEVSAQAATSVTPERLGELGAKIRKSPARSSELLAEYGLTEKTFEAEIRKVTEDPEASKRYAAAYKKASA
jgi:hypothetical protein